MKFKGATRRFGSVGLLFPLILLLLTVADSAFACPRHKTGVVYRTSAINNRTVSYMTPTVISYGAPVSYRRCSDNMYGAQSVRYVEQRSSGARYVAVPNDSGYDPFSRTRYLAARSIDPDDTSRYVVVRHSPAFVDTGSRYVAVRNYAPRTRSVAVRNIDYDDDAIRYVAVRRIAPQTRYVAVRNIDYDDDATRYVTVRRVAPQTRYVAVRNIDYDDDALDYVRVRNVDAPVDISSARHVVVKTDYLTGTEEVIVPQSSNDDTAYVEPGIDDVSMTTHVAYTPSEYTNRDSVTYHAASDMEIAYPEAVSTRTVSYVPISKNNYMDDQAFIDEEGTTYVAASNVDGACLSMGDVDTSPEVVTTRAVSYVPANYVENDASLMVSDPTYIETDDTAASVSYVPVANDLDHSCTCADALSTSDDNVGTSTVSYVPADEVADAVPETVSYDPAETVEIVAYE